MRLVKLRNVGLPSQEVWHYPGAKRLLKARAGKTDEPSSSKQLCLRWAKGLRPGGPTQALVSQVLKLGVGKWKTPRSHNCAHSDFLI